MSSVVRICSTVSLYAAAAWWCVGDPPRASGVSVVLCSWGVLAIWSGSTSVELPRSPAVVCLAALACRLVCLPAAPVLSDDLYRYLFEGMAVSSGHNPYLQSPASLAELDPDLASRVNHNDLPSIYPPIALAWFQFLAWIGRDGLIVRVSTSLVDVVAVGALAVSARRAHVARYAAWIWALHPLTVFESAWGGHVEIVAVDLAICGLLLVHRSAALGSALVWLSAGTKLFPVVFLLPLARLAGMGRTAVGGLIAAFATTVFAKDAMLAAFESTGSLGTYAAHWSFNGAIYPWLHPVLGAATRPTLLAAAGACVISATLRHRADPWRVWLVAGLAFVTCTPTMHPWYGVWLLAPAVVLGHLHIAAWCAWMPTAYLVLLTVDEATGAWSEGPWLWFATWLPPALWLLASRRLVRPTSANPPPKSARNGSVPQD